MIDPIHADPLHRELPSRRIVVQVTLGGFVAAGIIAVLFVFPVELGLDPTGFGRLTGLDRLSAPKLVRSAGSADPARSGATAGLLRTYAVPLRSDIIDIPLHASGPGAEGSELEYKVRMRSGDSLVYSWTVSGLSNAEEFYSDFHGETRPDGSGAAARVVEYRQATGLQSSGVLVAAMAGVHGWYLQNQSAGPVTVHLKLSGFYDLVPAGDYGNQAKLQARPLHD